MLPGPIWLYYSNVAVEHRGAEDGRCLGERVAGKYELRSLLGAGSMGAVYEGVHLELEKRVAVKVLRAEFCGSPEAVGRFRREARAASAVESEHIAQIFDFGRDERLGLYMVIEYLKGEDLEVRLARQPRIDTGEATTIAIHVARGLCRAHGAGIIHRDLKPANVFLTRRDDGSTLAKILDFGISKIHVAPQVPSGCVEPTLTQFGTTLGTPQYMSPEQCQAGAGIDGRTDVWSLCAVLYEMLAGEPAVSDVGGVIATMGRIVTKDIPPLGERAPWVPAEIARVVDEGLVRDPKRRLGGAAIMAARLVAACSVAAATEGVDAVPPSSGEDRVERFMRTGEVPVAIGKGAR